MLNFLPFLLLILGAASGAIFYFRKTRLAYSWIFMTIMGIVAWILVLFLPFNDLKPLIIDKWFSINDDFINLSFAIDHHNWPVVIMIITLELSFLFSSVMSPNKQSDFFQWIATQLIVAFIILALSAGNLWAVVLCWTAFDLVSITAKSFLNSRSLNINEFQPYFIKFIGSIILIWIIAYVGFDESVSGLENISKNIHLGLFLAAIFHAGAFNFRSSIKESHNQMLIDDFINLGSIAISISILFQVPSPLWNTLVGLIYKITFSTVSIYSAISCILTQDDTKKLQNLMMVFFSSIGLAFFMGNIDAGIFWLVLFVLSLGINRFFHFKNYFTIILFFFLILLSSGLPFTYLSYGARGMLATGFSMVAFLSILPHSLILAELMRVVVTNKNTLLETDPWKQAVYYAGIWLLMLTLAAMSLKYFSNIDAEFEFWWAGLSVALISSCLAIFTIRLNRKDHSINFASLKPMTNSIVFKNRVINTFRLLYSLIGQLLLAISTLLEGRGGILWAIVFLALLLTILRL